MKISDLLRTVADNIDVKADLDIDLDSLDYDKNEESQEELTDAMVPPLQQELELKKRSMGIRNAFDFVQESKQLDELTVLKKLTGL